MLTHNVHGLESPSPFGGANDLISLYKVVMARDIHRSKEVMANGNLTVKEKWSIDTFVELGNTLLEVELMLSCKCNFPHIFQNIFSATCPSGVWPNSPFHPIQSHQGMDMTTRLAHEFQLSIHFEHNYYFHKIEAVTLLKEWLDATHINLNREVITPIDVMIHCIHKNGWELQRLVRNTRILTLSPWSKVIELLFFY